MFQSCAFRPSARRALGALLSCALFLASLAHAEQTIVLGPAGSGAFGKQVAMLPSGNIVVTDPDYDAPGPMANVGAAYLYRPDGSLVSALFGTTANDRVGSGPIVVLPSGNYLVISSTWNNGTAISAGAVTFASGITGISGVVSSANSLVGDRVDSRVGSDGVVVLDSGNYVVRSARWRNEFGFEAGAVTFGSGVTGVAGVVSSINSLVGGAGDLLGFYDIVRLSNGNYVVPNPNWNNGAAEDAGAVTFASGTTGVTGAVSAENSLVGTKEFDEVGYDVKAVGNGNYVVLSPFWDNGSTLDAGAVTFASGSVGATGPVTSSNSLVGPALGDRVGADVVVLSNGDYVVHSPTWDHGVAQNVGAVTLGSGANGIIGVVSPSNSLIGASANDLVGSIDAIALSNGGYVVPTPTWDSGAAADAGAITFGSASIGVIGTVSSGNSLVGTHAGDLVGSGTVVPLPNGNYVVLNPQWTNSSTANAGAVTFGSGTNGVVGAIAPSNSLVGTRVNDKVGEGGVTVLANGNYVISSPSWDSATVGDVGAATFAFGMTGISGVIASTNSLIGSTLGDQVGKDGIVALGNGNYVVRSTMWDNGNSAVDAGAVTFGNGNVGVAGTVSATNSLVGNALVERIGSSGVLTLSNGNYVVLSPDWNQGAGAATFGSGVDGVVGSALSANSLIGSTPGDRVGTGGLALSHGNYLVLSQDWRNNVSMQFVHFGAVTFCPGSSGRVGIVSSSNSLIGSTPMDRLGEPGDPPEFQAAGPSQIALSDGSYVVRSRWWDNGTTVDAGAVSLGTVDGSLVGPIGAPASVVGTVANGGESHVFDYDALRKRLAVGQPLSNRVVLVRQDVDSIFSDGME